MKRVAIIGVVALVVAGVIPGRAEELVLDPATSRIEVAVSATMDSFVGVLEKYTAKVEAPAAGALPPRAEVKFDFKDFKTGNVKRDAAMLEWLDYTNFSGASFVLTGWKKDGTNDLATGEFSLHGVKKDLTLPAQVRQAGDNWTISGQANLNHLDYGLKKIRKFALLTVDPRLKVKFELHLKRATPKT